MTYEQFQLLNNFIDTIDLATGKLLMGLDRNGQLIYIQRTNPDVHGFDSNGNFGKSKRYQVKDHSRIKAAFRYEDG